MPTTLTTARLAPRVAVQVAPVWIGGTPIVEMRLDADAENPGKTGTPLDKGLVQRIQFTVYRQTDSLEAVVDPYNAQDLDPESAFRAEVATWSYDPYGYNFRHIVPAAAVNTPALHRVVYWFTLTSGEVVAVPVRFPMLGPIGGATTGTGGGGGGGVVVPPVEGDEEFLMYSLTAGVTITGSADELTLLGTGPGSLTIAAGGWPVGGLIRIQGGGVYKSRAATPGTFTWRQKVAGDATLDVELNLYANQTDWQPFTVRAELVRLTTTTVVGQLAIKMQAGPQETGGTRGWSAPQAVAMDAAKTLDFTGQFSTSDPANQLRLDYWAYQILKVGQSA